MENQSMDDLGVPLPPFKETPILIKKRRAKKENHPVRFRLQMSDATPGCFEIAHTRVHWNLPRILGVHQQLTCMCSGL